MKVCDKCGSEQKDENRFCAICGNLLKDTTGGNIWCINCAAIISERDEKCTTCGHAVLKGNVQLQKKVEKIEDTIGILDRKINMQSLRIEKIIKLVEKNLEPEVLSEQTKTKIEHQSDYKITTPAHVPESVKIPPPVEVPSPVEIPSVQASKTTRETRLEPPTLPMMLPRFSVKEFVPVEEIRIERRRSRIRVEKQTATMRVFAFLVNQVQPIIASALLIGAFMLLAISLQLPPVFQGMAFGIIGIIAMGLGHITIGGRVFGIAFENLRSREVGIFLINFGMGLGLGVAWVTSGNQMLRLIPSLIYIGIPAVLGYIHRSDFTKSMTVVAILANSVVLSTSGLPWIMEFGGIIPIGTVLLYLFVIEKSSISWVPSLILMVGGPLIVVSHFLSTGAMVVPALGIVLSLFPMAYFLHRGYIELIKPYYYSVYTFFFLWPVVAFSVILDASTNTLPFDPAILFSGLAIAFHLSTSVMHKKFEGSELLREVSQKLDHVTKIYVPFLGTLVIAYQQILLESVSTSIIGFAGTFVLPQLLLCLLFAAYVVFVHWNKFWTEKSNLFEKWSSILVLDLAILVSTIRLTNQIASLSNPDLIVVSVIGITGIMPILGAFVQLYARKWVDSKELLNKTSIMAIINAFVLTVGFVEGIAALGVTFSSLIVFLMALMLPKLDSFQRKEYYQLSLIGNFFIVVFGQVLNRYSKIEIQWIAGLLKSNQIATIGPFIIFAIYIIFAGVSFLFLNRIIPERTTSNLSHNDVIADFGKLPSFLGQKVIEYQEILFSTLTNLSFIVFLTTNGFIMGSDWSYVEPTFVTVAFMLVNAITIYNTRGRHWGSIVPAYLSFLMAMYYIDDPTFNALVQLTILPIYLVSVWISHQDRIKKRIGSRIFFRDATAWIVFSLMLFSERLNPMTTVIAFSFLLGSSIYQTFRFKKVISLGFVPVLAATAISRIQSIYETSWAVDLNYFMSISILLAFTALHFLGSLAEEQVEDRQIFTRLTYNTVDTIRKVLPVFSAIFLVRPETIEGLAISHVWFFLLSLLIVGIFETTGFDRKKIVGVLPLFVLNFLTMPPSTEFWQGILLFATFITIVAYVILRSSFSGDSEKDIYQPLIGVLSAAIFYAFSLNVSQFSSLILLGFASASIIHIFEGVKNENKWNALSIAVFISLVALLAQQVGNIAIGDIEVALVISPYLVLSAYLLTKLFYRQNLSDQSISVIGISIAVVSWLSPEIFGFIDTMIIAVAVVAVLLIQYRNYNLVSSIFVQIGFFLLIFKSSGSLQEIAYVGFITQMIFYRIFAKRRKLTLARDRINLYQYVLLPLPFFAGIFMDNPLSQTVAYVVIGLLSIVNEAIEDHEFRGMSTIIFVALIKVLHSLQPNKTVDIGFTSTEGLLIASFIILAGIFYLLKYGDRSRYSTEKQLISYFIFYFVSFEVAQSETTFFMALPLAALSFVLWNKDQKSIEDILDVTFLTVSSLLFAFSKSQLAFVPLMFFFANLILNSFRGILRKTESSLVRMAAFGAGLLVVGMFLGEKAAVWSLASEFIPQIIQDSAWAVILGFWLISINILVGSTSDLEIKGIKNLSATGLAISTTISTMALASVMWINLTNLNSLFLLLSIGSFFLFIVVLVNRDLSLSKRNDIPFIFGSVLGILVGLRQFELTFEQKYRLSVLVNALSFGAKEAVAFAIFLPIALSLIPLSLRLVAKGDISRIVDGNKLDILVFFSVFTFSLFWIPDVGEVSSGMTIIFWSLFVLSASIGKKETATISSVIMSLMAFVFGINNSWFQNLVIAGEKINGGGITLLIISALMFLYLWKVNFENIYNECHDIVFSTTVGTSLIALILMTDLQNTAGRAILFNGMVLLSISVMAFAVKFNIRKYEIVATAIIYGALILGVGALIILGSSGTLNLTVTMITLFSGGLGFLINIGLQNINRLSEKARFLKIFAPREVIKQ